jgi:hypothetical protein
MGILFSFGVLGHAALRPTAKEAAPAQVIDAKVVLNDAGAARAEDAIG